MIDLDLGLGQVQGVGELGPLRDGQVLLLAELSLQCQQLRGSERRARFAVVFVLAQSALRGTGAPCDRTTQNKIRFICAN